MFPVAFADVFGARANRFVFGLCVLEFAARQLPDFHQNVSTDCNVPFRFYSASVASRITNKKLSFFRVNFSPILSSNA
jgi:hypothetical protein